MYHFFVCLFTIRLMYTLNISWLIIYPITINLYKKKCNFAVFQSFVCLSMGCIQNRDALNETKLNQEIQRDMKIEEKRPILKILLIGTGSSGTTTILKQLWHINSGKDLSIHTVNLLIYGYIKEVELLLNKDFIYTFPASICKLCTEYYRFFIYNQDIKWYFKRWF